MLPGLESYLSYDRTSYAVLATGPQYPHACTSFEYPVKYTVSIKENPENSLLFVVLRGRDRAEDINWRVYVNEVKVSRVFKPQHFLRLQSDIYYVYVADISPVAKSADVVELLIKCHARDTHIESAGLVALLPDEFRSKISVHIGISRIEKEYDLQIGEHGFSIVSIVGRGDGGTITIGGISKKVNSLFEFSELLPDNQVNIAGPVNVYALVTNAYSGEPPDVSVSDFSVEPERVKLVLINPGDYGVSNIDLRLLRGTQTLYRLNIKRMKPRESTEVTIDKPTPGATSIKITYEFAGHVFTRVLQLSSS